MKLRSPIDLTSPIQFNASLPAEVDVVVVGGGIVGISTAMALVEQGAKVLVCEKGRVAAEQSSRNWGWVRQTGRDADELPIMMESIQLWRDMAARTGENSLVFNQSGVLYLADSDADMSKFAAFVKLAANHGLESRLLSAAEVAAKMPNAGRQWQGGLYTQSDGRVEPWSATPAMARAASRSGALIAEDCAVRTIDTTNSKVSAVITEKGRIKTANVLVAGGVWSSLLARQCGVYLPQLAVKATVARAKCPVPLFGGNAADGELAFAARQDGGYTLALGDHHDFYIGPDAFRYLKLFRHAARRKAHENRFHLASPAGYPDAWRTSRSWAANEVSPFEQCRVVDPQADPKLVARMQARLLQRFRDCESAVITQAWAGMIDTTPDFVPVMDQAPDTAGLFIATGFSGHGFGIGPGAGRCMADLILGRDPGHDLSRFRLNRFSDGSRLKLGPM